MAIDSSEIPHKQAEVKPESPRGRPIGDKMIIGGAKFGGKVVTGLARFGWAINKPVTYGTVAVGLGVGAANPDQTIKQVGDFIHDPVGKTLDLGKNVDPKVQIEGLSGDNASVFDVVFPNLSQAEKEVAFANVAHAREDVDKYFNEEIVRHVHSDFEAKVKKAAEENQVPFEVLMGMLLWESKGDPNAESDADAVGIFQWTKDVAYEEDVVVNDQVDGRRDPDIIIPAEGKKFAKDVKKLGSIDAAVQAHHMGLKGYSDLARSYLERHYGLTLQDILVKPTEETDEARKIANDQADYNLRVIRLNLIQHKVSADDVINDPENQAKISGTEYDSTVKFRAYIVAAYNYYAQKKAELDLK